MTHHNAQFGSSSVSRYRTTLTVAALFLFAFGIFTPSYPLVAKQSTAVTSNIGLTLTANPSILPADGGSYSALVLEFRDSTTGAPYVPETDTTVLLTSSSPQTGTVPSNVTFPAGAVYLLVNFSTTTLPGNTVISAIAPGYSAATLVVATKTVGGMPNGLLVFLSPNQIPPNEKMNSSVVVEAVDSSGNPVALGSPLTVSLSSSNTQIGSVPQLLVIQAGQSFGSATFSPTYIAGSTTITASAGNFTFGSAVMTTIGPIARRLVLSAAPSVIPAIANAATTISVQLQDNNSQTPALAPSPVSVVLTSNNTVVATIPSSIITIPAGSSYASVTVNFGGYCPSPLASPNNVANLTASAQGYIKGSVLVTCANPTAVSNGLIEYFAPNTLLPNNQTYPNVLVVQLVYAQGGSITPSIAQTSRTVYARSSNNATMQVNTVQQVMQAGATQVEFNVSSTFLPGQVAITAQSPGLSSDTLNLLSFGGAPTALKLQFAPSTLLSDGKTYSPITLGLVGSSGVPAQAPVNTVVTLSSTISSIGQVQSTVIIPAGQTYARATFATYGFAGSTLITASTSNYTSANSTLILVTKAATNLGVSSSPAIVLANGQQYQNLIVQLQDPFGDPEKTDVAVPVQIAVQNTTVGSVSPQIVIPPGSTFAHILINSTYLAGKTNVTAFATGFTPGHALFTTTLLPLNVRVSTPLTFLKPGEAANVSLIVTSNNLPLGGANVHWSISPGKLVNMVNSTNAKGFASALFPGATILESVVIVTNVSKPGYVATVSQTSLTIASPNPTSTHPNGLVGTMEEKILFIPLWSLIVIVVVAGLAGFLFIRRRSASGEAEIEEEE